MSEILTYSSNMSGFSKVGKTNKTKNQLKALKALRDLLKVVEEKCSSSFKFGDGNTVLSNKAVTILETIGKNGASIKLDAIQNDLPLLLRKDSIKNVMLRSS